MDLYADRVRGAIGSLAATLGGLDALVFTAGVGEHAVGLRAAACEGLEFLGLRLDPSANASCQPDADIATADSPARILVLHTREELVVARETRRLVLAAPWNVGPSPEGTTSPLPIWGFALHSALSS